MTKRTLHPTLQAVLDEHIALPGCPQIIVTRGWCSVWLRDALGYDPKATGFGSIDYMSFGHKPVDEPLTDLTQPHIANLLAFMERTERGEA
jgi:hypothetical protein